MQQIESNANLLAQRQQRTLCILFLNPPFTKRRIIDFNIFPEKQITFLKSSHPCIPLLLWFFKVICVCFGLQWIYDVWICNTLVITSVVFYHLTKNRQQEMETFPIDATFHWRIITILHWWVSCTQPVQPSWSPAVNAGVPCLVKSQETFSFFAVAHNHKLVSSAQCSCIQAEQPDDFFSPLSIHSSILVLFFLSLLFFFF